MIKVHINIYTFIFKLMSSFIILPTPYNFSILNYKLQCIYNSSIYLFTYYICLPKPVPVGKRGVILELTLLVWPNISESLMKASWWRSIDYPICLIPLGQVIFLPRHILRKFNIYANFNIHEHTLTTLVTWSLLLSSSFLIIQNLRLMSKLSFPFNHVKD